MANPDGPRRRPSPAETRVVRGRRSPLGSPADCPAALLPSGFRRFLLDQSDPARPRTSLDYSNLEIADGGLASLEYYRMAFGRTDAAEKTRIRASLLEYCKRDTLAMLEIRKILLQKTLEPRDQNLTPV